MNYISKQERIAKFISNNIISNLALTDLDYEKVISIICSELSVSRSAAEAALRAKIPAHIKEIHILTLPDEKIIPLLAKIRANENQLNKELGDVGIK